MMAQELDQTNVFVKYLPAELDDAGLKDLFAPYGDIISSKVMVDHQTGSSLGYGYVLRDYYSSVFQLFLFLKYESHSIYS
jgi:RNA recognition motif-containing protein